MKYTFQPALTIFTPVTNGMGTKEDVCEENDDACIRIGTIAKIFMWHNIKTSHPSSHTFSFFAIFGSWLFH